MQLLVVVITFIGQFLGGIGTLDESIVFLGITYIVISFAFTLLVVLLPKSSKPIAIIGVLTDTFIICFIMYMGADKEAALYGLLLFLIIANGLRFGNTHMKFVTIVVFFSYLIVILTNDFWQSHNMMSVGNLVWLVLIPAHIKNLLTKLEVAVDKAESANKAKSMFIANMSHEIRTPLTAIIGFSKTLLKKNISPEKANTNIETIIRNGEHLSVIINDILDISKIEAGELNIDPKDCNLFGIFSEIELTFKPRAENKGLAFSIDCHFPLPEIIYSDSVRIKQILINLCGNAIKFTNNGEIKIDVRFNAEDEMLEICVSDTGIGLTEIQRENIFSVFAQADNSTTRNFGGTGLGLSISKTLTEMLGGELWVESKIDVGSEFYFTLTTGEIASNSLVNKKPITPKLETDQTEPSTSVTGNVLLVEDVKDNQILISILLEGLGAKVDIANNGQIALDKTSNKTYDLVLMDLQMPVMGGKEALQKMRQRGYTKPVVILTADVIQNGKNKPSNDDCQGFLSKPIEEKKFEEVVYAFLPKSKSITEKPIKEDIELDKKNDTTSDAIISTLLAKKSERLHKIAKQFAAELKARIEEIEATFNSNDQKKLARLVHNLKGLGGNMGYNILTEITVKIEGEIKNQNTDGIKEGISALYDAEQRIKAGLSSDSSQ